MLVDGLIPGAFQLLAFITFGLTVLHLIVGRATTVVAGFLAGLAATGVHQAIHLDEGWSPAWAVAVLLALPVIAKIWIALRQLPVQRQVDQLRADAFTQPHRRTGRT